jgi:hypothetical protein
LRKIEFDKRISEVQAGVRSADSLIFDCPDMSIPWERRVRGEAWRVVLTFNSLIYGPLFRTEFILERPTLTSVTIIAAGEK